MNLAYCPFESFFFFPMKISFPRKKLLALVPNTTQKIYFCNILKQNAASSPTDVSSGRRLIFLVLLIYAGMSEGVDGAVVRRSGLKHNCPVALFCLTQLREAAWISPPEPPPPPPKTQEHIHLS